MTVRLRLKIDPDKSVRDDVDRWVAALKVRGFQTSKENVYVAWRQYSETSCARWLDSYGDDESDCRALLTQLEPEDASRTAMV